MSAPEEFCLSRAIQMFALLLLLLLLLSAVLQQQLVGVWVGRSLGKQVRL